MKVFAERDNVNDEEVIIATINYSNNQKVDKGSVICQLDTSKTAIDVEAPKAGYLKLHVNEGDEVPIGNCLFEILDNKESENLVEKEKKEKSSKKEYIFSKEAKAKIDELGITEYSFDKKMVSIEDVLNLAGPNSSSESKDIISKNSEKSNRSTISAELPQQEYEINKFTIRKRSEIKNLSSNGNISTQSVIGIDIKVLPKRSYDVTYMFRDSISDLVVYEGSKLLKQYDELNSFYINEKEFGTYKDVNLGFSFDNNSNLKVLSILDTPNLSLTEVQNKIIELLELYESGETIDSELITKATITISDLSKTQSSFMLPLVSQNQSAIIGITKFSDNLFKLFVGFDHKVTSGLYVSNYLNDLKKKIESHFYGEEFSKYIKCSKCELSGEEAKALGHRGFVKVVNFSGEEELICENCFNGF